MKITSLFTDQVQEIIPDFHGKRRVQNCLNFSMLNIQLTCIVRFGYVCQKKVSLVLNCVTPDPDPNWFVDMGYKPLTLNVMGGPYFLSSTNAVDLTRIREIDDQIAPPEIAQDNRFLNMFQQDGEVNNRESIEVNLPIWVPIVISVLVGFAMGLGKV